MKKLILSLVVIAMTVTTLNASDTQAIKQEGIKYIKMLGSALKKEVKAKMKEDPTGVHAMKFCSTKANEITQKVNQQLPKQAQVRRTALKVRNLANKPDAVDKNVMRSYQEAIEKKSFKPSDIRVVETKEAYRVYKPLLVKAMCLKCHGSNLSSEITEIIKKTYPKDQATGFKEGDLRGVIVAEIKKD